MTDSQYKFLNKILWYSYKNLNKRWPSYKNLKTPYDWLSNKNLTSFMIKILH